MLEIRKVGQKYFESGLKKILLRESRNSRIVMKKFSNLEREAPIIRKGSNKSGIKSIRSWIPEDQKLGRWNSLWDARNSESGIKIFRKWIKEDFVVEFKKLKNCDEEVLKFRKRSSQNKIKKE